MSAGSTCRHEKSSSKNLIYELHLQQTNFSTKSRHGQNSVWRLHASLYKRYIYLYTWFAQWCVNPKVLDSNPGAGRLRSLWRLNQIFTHGFQQKMVLVNNWDWYSTIIPEPYADEWLRLLLHHLPASSSKNNTVPEMQQGPTSPVCPCSTENKNKSTNRQGLK